MAFSQGIHAISCNHTYKIYVLAVFVRIGCWELKAFMTHLKSLRKAYQGQKILNNSIYPDIV